MSYIEENLLPNEKIHLKAKISPALFFIPIMVFAISLFVLGYAISLGNQQNDATSIIATVYFCFSGFIFFIAILVTIRE